MTKVKVPLACFAHLRLAGVGTLVDYMWIDVETGWRIYMAQAAAVAIS